MWGLLYLGRNAEINRFLYEYRTERLLLSAARLSCYEFYWCEDSPS